MNLLPDNDPNSVAAEPQDLFTGLAGIVFDFDGVLVDSVQVKSEAFASLYSEQDPAFRSEVVRHHLEHAGISRHEKIRYFEELRTGEVPEDADVVRLANAFASLVKDRVIKAPELPGASRALTGLSARFPLFICSGTPEVELQEIVAARGWSHHFAGVYGSPSTKVEILRRIVDGLGRAAGDVLMVGDSTTDSDAAHETGTRFLLVGDTRAARSTHISHSVASPAQLLDWL